ncbi:phage gp6-like head-tail connector protein [Vaginisenegalia massiliensis]|uniref:phage gp6-like head-tail connector protein n=1 Tax=Vaginisenegalia massiliensis TaxID=2058294 RepID=UPI000F54B47D|nr:phage gp6-like head-tail connector protein [Vaginisenegalia massiliensis]
MDELLLAELLKVVKEHLAITFNHLDDSLKDDIAEGIDVINLACGPSDFSKPGIERKLLKNYVRYARNNATEMFEDNFLSDLWKLKLKNAQKARLT